MKSFRLFIGNLVFLLMFCGVAFAQTENPTQKIGLINAELFQDKQTGIRGIIEANEKLGAEFNAQTEELKLLSGKIPELEKEFKDFQELEKKFNYAHFLYCDSSISKKVDAYDKLITEYKQKEKEYGELYLKRQTEVFADVYKRIGDALKQFAKENGYAVILDNSKNQSSFLFNLEELKKEEELTKEFIRYYNENFAKAK